MNSVVLIGRLTRDPELRFIAGSGRAVANFTLAIDRNLAKDKKAEMQSKGLPTADFIRVVVWGKQAENCTDYISKGSLVAINGSIQTSSYKTNTGETRYSTDVLASRIEFLDYKDSKKSEGYELEFQAKEDDDDIPF